jgi:hypothetical protein
MTNRPRPYLLGLALQRDGRSGEAEAVLRQLAGVNRPQCGMASVGDARPLL